MLLKEIILLHEFGFKEVHKNTFMNGGVCLYMFEDVWQVSIVELNKYFSLGNDHIIKKEMIYLTKLANKTIQQNIDCLKEVIKERDEFYLTHHE